MNASSTIEPDLQAVALDYAAKGLRVFPCNSNKQPMIDGGLHSASNDPEVVRGWWERWPEAMIGMPTGAASGFWALDIDDPAAFEAACTFDMPATRRVDTGKGYHLYFKYDPAAPMRNHQRHPKRGWPFPSLSGAETRGDGGYVIVPPSLHPSGRRYNWHDGAAMVDAPAPLLAIIKKGASRDEQPRNEWKADGSDTRYGLAALDRECAAVRAAGDGEQECALNEAALKIGSLVAGGELSLNTARASLLAAGLAMPSYNSRDAWTPEKIVAKVERALADGASQPRSAPERDERRAGRQADDPGSAGGTGSADDGSQWEPVDLWGCFDPPPLPEGLLPPILEQFAKVNGDQMGADPAGLAVGALVTCAAAIPDEIRLKVKRHGDWYESARIWAALVGDPSTKKTPVISAATGPICRLDLRLMREWLSRLKEWQDAEGPKGPKPLQSRLRIEDTTVEGAQQVLEGSPWGVLLLQDELSGFFGAMDKYGGGKAAQADRAFWLRSFNGGPYAINRVTRGAAVIDNLSVCMLGGIQPEPLRKIAGDAADDGLLQRLFPIMLRRATMGRDEPAPAVNDMYRDLIEQLHELRSPGFMNSSPLEFTNEAQEIRRALEAKHLELQSLETINRKLASHIGKYDGLFARLCVVWHCIENIGNPHGLAVFIEAATAQRVADFLHGFLLAHAVAFYGGVLGLSDDHDRLTSIAGHILAHRLTKVTNRDIARGDRSMRGLKDYEVRPLLEQLEALGWLERVEPPRPSSPPHFAVNPLVHERFADKASAEALRRKEARETIAGLMS